jgi:poly(A) polymerase
MIRSIDDKKISKNAIKVLSKLQDKGFQGYLVGGCIRDLLIGSQPKDFDIATNAHPERIRELFSNARIIGRRFKIVHVRFENEIIEVSTFRKSDSKDLENNQTEAGMIISDNTFGSLEEDSLRRDFRINSIYYNPLSKELIDLQDGLADVYAGVVKSIGEPDLRLREDPVRMLRAIRIGSKLEFSLETKIKEGIRSLGYLIQDVSPARLFEESLKMFMGGFGVKVYLALKELDLFNWIFPESARSQNKYNLDLLIRKALESTDDRVEKGLPITPAFIYAAILWYPFIIERARIITELGANNYDASNEAATNILSTQQLFTSIPRRFSNPVKEIWFLQFRLGSRHGKNPEYLLKHKRFRAAYDFLLIREAAGEQTQNLGEWWTRYQFASEEEKKQIQKNDKKNQRKRELKNNE